MSKKKAIKKEPPFQLGAGYGWTGMSPATMTKKFKRATEEVAALQLIHKFDALAFMGSSGCAIAFILSVSLQIPLIYVRKDNEDSHGSMIEGNAWRGVTKFLIVDDFIGRGTTVETIYTKIRSAAEQRGRAKPECAGIFLYEPADNDTRYSFSDATVPIFR